MVQFYGELSDEATEHMQKQNNKTSPRATIVMAIFLPIIAFAAVLFQFENLWAAVISAVVVEVLFLVGSKIVKRQDRKQKHVSKTTFRITVSNDSVTIDTGLSKSSRPLSQVKNVVDMGDWYSINFKSGKGASTVICQKNLLVSGTLQEFEQIFASTLTRQIGQ